VIFLSSAIISAAFPAIVSAQPAILDPVTIPKWVNQLTGPPLVYLPQNITNQKGQVIRQDYIVNITQFYQQILPVTDKDGNPTGFGSTKVWGYAGYVENPITGEQLGFYQSTPGPTFVATRGIPTRVQWTNRLIDSSGRPLPSLFTIDPTLTWANPNNINKTQASIQAAQGLIPPSEIGYNGSSIQLADGRIANPKQWNAQSPVPVVVHLHGGEDPAASDGSPNAWFTPNGIHGPDYQSIIPTSPNAAVYEYPNAQEPTTLWYHDHALGITRTNAYSGLVGTYILKDPNDPTDQLMPTGEFDIPLVIQDKSFLTNGQLYFPSQGDYPTIHPYETMAFLGNTIMVNGKVWPNLNVNQGQYRFRIIDASNDRFYQLKLSNSQSFVQVGTDGGYLKTPVLLNSLQIGPGERADILIDFSNAAPGTTIILENDLLATSSPTERQTVGQIMQFTVQQNKGPSAKNLPVALNSDLSGAYPTLPIPTKTRTLTLAETLGTNNMLQIATYLDGQIMNSPTSEIPVLGTTEEWDIVDPTTTAHMIHLHLIQFQIIQRRAFNSTAYLKEWRNLNGDPPFNHSTINVKSLSKYFIGTPISVPPNEQGWKDTVVAYAGEITTIRIRFTRQDGTEFPFDATSKPGYFWHCHLLDHEDNEMMRPYTLTNPTKNVNQQYIIIIAVIITVSCILGTVAVGYRRKTRNRNINNQTTNTKNDK
jgi:FtsP/CotA-like multicopper oxidase with cupredoxin domain